MPVGGASSVAKGAGDDCAEAIGSTINAKPAIADRRAMFLSECDTEGPLIPTDSFSLVVDQAHHTLGDRASQ